MKMHKLIALFLCIIILSSLPCTLAACKKEAQNHSNIHWKMYGAWVTESGQYQDKLEMSVSGKLPQEYENYDVVELELDIVWPEDFRFGHDGKITYYGYADMFKSDDPLPIFWCSGYNYDLEYADTVAFTFILCPSEEYIIWHWPQADIYFAASTDPDADIKEMRDQFQNFFNHTA